MILKVWTILKASKKGFKKVKLNPYFFIHCYIIGNHDNALCSNVLHLNKKFSWEVLGGGGVDIILKQIYLNEYAELDSKTLYIVFYLIFLWPIKYLLSEHCIKVKDRIKTSCTFGQLVHLCLHLLKSMFGMFSVASHQILIDHRWFFTFSYNAIWSPIRFVLLNWLRQAAQCTKNRCEGACKKKIDLLLRCNISPDFLDKSAPNPQKTSGAYVAQR